MVVLFLEGERGRGSMYIFSQYELGSQASDLVTHVLLYILYSRYISKYM